MIKQELHPRTAVINKKQKNKSKRARLDALAWLAKTFPKAFDNSIRISPLKKGIMVDIMEYAETALAADISKSKLREAVVLFTRRLDYLACLKAREMRINLSGDAVEVVTEEEAEHAAIKIKKRIEKSARNGRKLMAERHGHAHTSSTPSHQTSHYHTRSQQTFSSESDDFVPIYPPRSTPYGVPAPSAQAARVSAVMVTHKTTKQFDPDAVARLKEKLGLSRNADVKKEELVD